MIVSVKYRQLVLSLFLQLYASIRCMNFLHENVQKQTITYLSYVFVFYRKNQAWLCYTNHSIGVIVVYVFVTLVFVFDSKLSSQKLLSKGPGRA